MKYLNSNSKYLLLAVLTMVGMTACKKNNLVVDVDPLVLSDVARFVMTPTASNSKYSYAISADPAPGSVFKIPVGVTTVSSSDRKVKFAYSSTTAVQGVHYTAPTELTIPAGSAMDTLMIQGLYDGFDAGVTLELKIKISSETGFIKAQSFQDSVILVMQKACTPFAITNMLGDYNETNLYGPYTTSVSSYTQLSATSAKITVENIFDYGWNPIEFTLNWSDSNNPTVTLEEQTGVGPGSTVGYAGYDVAVRPYPGEVGTFINNSNCTQQIILRLQVGLEGLGWFNDLYEVTMER